MAYHDPLRMPAAGLDAAWQQPRRAGRDDDAGARHPIDVREQRSFQCLVFRTALLHEVGVLHGTVEVAGEGEAPSGRASGQPHARQRRPSVGDGRAQPGLGARRGIPGHDVEPSGERPRGPATPDHTGADYGEPQTPFSFPPPLADESRSISFPPPLAGEGRVGVLPAPRGRARRAAPIAPPSASGAG